MLHADPPRVLLKALNWLLSDEADPCSVDVVAAVVNPKSGAAEIATAGRIGAILVGQGGKAKKLTKLDSPAVGNGQPIEYTGLTIRVNDSETLAFYTPAASRRRTRAANRLAKAGLSRPCAKDLAGRHRRPWTSCSSIWRDTSRIRRPGPIARYYLPTVRRSPAGCCPARNDGVSCVWVDGLSGCPARRKNHL